MKVPPRKSDGACCQTACTFDVVVSQKSVHCTVMSSYHLSHIAFVFFVPPSKRFFCLVFIDRRAPVSPPTVSWSGTFPPSLFPLGMLLRSRCSGLLVLPNGLPPAISWHRRCRPAPGRVLCVPPPSGWSGASSRLTFVIYSVVEAASRQGISPSALMKVRWVVTFKDDGSLKARLVVQGLKHQRLGKIPTSSPTASRRSRQIFLTLAASLGFQTHKEDVKCAFLHGDLDEQRVDDDDDDDNFKLQSSANQSPTYLESCNWSIISVFDCWRPYTFMLILQEDGTTVLRLVFET